MISKQKVQNVPYTFVFIAIECIYKGVCACVSVHVCPVWVTDLPESPSNRTWPSKDTHRCRKRAAVQMIWSNSLFSSCKILPLPLALFLYKSILIFLCYHLSRSIKQSSCTAFIARRRSRKAFTNLIMTASAFAAHFLKI